MNGVYHQLVEQIRLEQEERERMQTMDGREDGAISKVDHGKPEMSIILDAPRSMEAFAKIMKQGGEKDGRTLTSWKDYDDARGLESALMRHLYAWHQGDTIDDESGVSHLGHVVANAIMLCETEKSYVPVGKHKLNKREKQWLNK